MSGVCVGDIGESETHTDREIENAMEMITPGNVTSMIGRVNIVWVLAVYSVVVTRQICEIR